MSGFALGIVLLAALFHAAWNFLAKKSLNKMAFIWWFLLIASLFIILAARLKLEDLAYLGWGSLVFLAILILIARPASIFLLYL